MAIQLSFTKEDGTSGDYWYLDDAHIYRRKMMLVFSYYLFKDFASIQSGKSDMNYSKTFSYKDGIVDSQTGLVVNKFTDLMTQWANQPTLPLIEIEVLANEPFFANSTQVADL